MTSQLSDISCRAKKIYKNKEFHLLLREIISNAFQSLILSSFTDKKLKVNIDTNSDKSCIITIIDNGEGFNSKNREYFKVLDKENKEKTAKGFNPMGQGRLSIIHFANSADYESTYEEENKIYQINFSYPQLPQLNLFDKETTELTSKTIARETKVSINVKDVAKLARTHKFFKRYDNIDSFNDWFKEQFFPFIASNNIEIEINYNGEEKSIKLENVDHQQFIIESLEEEKEFNLYNIEVKKTDVKKTDAQQKSQFSCCARGLICKLKSSENITYDLKNINKAFFLTAKYFDNKIDDRGEEIDIDSNIIAEIQTQVNEILDKKFNSNISSNKKETENNLKKFRKTRPSFSMFLNEEEILDTTRNIYTTKDLQTKASDTKTKEEIKFWNDEESSYRDKVIKSSLYNYFKHRENILKTFKDDFLEKLNKKGDKKNQNEAEIHEILFQRNNKTCDDLENNYFKHNLWLIDDKYSLFTTAHSTTQGQKGSDIYLYCDNEKANDIVIIEVKSTHKSHNPGGMIEQITTYAEDCYKKKNNILKGSISNTEKCRYTAFIIAPQDDIQKELQKRKKGGAILKRITFLENSYYLDAVFSDKDIPIRIELFSYLDLYTLANSRNAPLIDLMYNY